MRKTNTNSLKINDQCGYVYENNGSAFQEPRPSGNVIENKGSYTSNAGILLKRSKLAVTRNLRGRLAPPPRKYHVKDMKKVLGLETEKYGEQVNPC